MSDKEETQDDVTRPEDAQPILNETPEPGNDVVEPESEITTPREEAVETPREEAREEFINLDELNFSNLDNLCKPDELNFGLGDINIFSD